ncbi:uncharacterized protein BO88DRAFT_399714 [Aspergillus vadensis CBS 113365]|uniref:Uncharacterized protein n=1 Tax=Aspergillus vadensis (strain CBS 113365 / IMI 142717 / IBT 24658) TaxID=1448311 RepID=A0A319BS46_ASPVC|nr:hypothetical protein BO88DRAFT_399714 [Aspergillus vadensis CBS 113365]PYH74040.1 hypothetical protein BO88DRAFT_399714 [Aspergillus vadensis CBS 113365]
MQERCRRWQRGVPEACWGSDEKEVAGVQTINESHDAIAGSNEKTEMRRRKKDERLEEEGKRIRKRERGCVKREGVSRKLEGAPTGGGKKGRPAVELNKRHSRFHHPRLQGAHGSTLLENIIIISLEGW